MGALLLMCALALPVSRAADGDSDSWNEAAPDAGGGGSTAGPPATSPTVPPAQGPGQNAPPPAGGIVAYDMSGNPIPQSELPDPTAPGGPDRVFVTPGQNGGPGTVHVVRDGKESQFAETNRTLKQQLDRGFLSDKPKGNLLSLDELKGKKVLDLAAGTQGKTVRDLRDMGIDASGMDIALSEQAKDTDYLRRADLGTTVPFDEKFDVAFELYGGLSYGLGDQTGKAFDNVVSRLKPGGTLYLVPLDKKAQEQLLPLVEKLGGKLTRSRYHGDDEVWRIVMPGGA
jgi:hypothetical protein